jgi:hypothetical protein
VINSVAGLALLLCAATEPCQAVDTAMICAWKRTFHAYDALRTPLRGYYMIRQPNYLCWDGSIGGGREHEQGPVTYGPVGFERLGQIPNDIDLSLNAPER